MNDEIDMEALRAVPHEALPKLITAIQKTVRPHEGYVATVRASGITGNIRAGNFLSYDAIKDLVTCVLERSDLDGDQTIRLRKIRDFWDNEEDLLRNGFYGNGHIELPKPKKPSREECK